jgi:hypothetical protein
MKNPTVALCSVFVLGTLAGALLATAILAPSNTAHAQPPAPKEPDLAALRADVDRLKQVATDQSHVMADVGYHYANLWFAAEGGNWPLATFCADETRSHLRWAVRVIPVRKDPAGRDVDLRGILEAVEKGPFKDVQDAVAAKDKGKFEATYRTMLESCYACHQASGKPYLRPRVPEQPAQPILDYGPQEGSAAK